MQFIHPIDFLAPLPNPLVNVLALPSSSPPAINDRAFQSISANRFTYAIMGLAIVIAILIPLLNWD